MAIATKPKPKAPHHKKRSGAHHRHTKHYVKSYWPYLPMVAIIAAGFLINTWLTHPVTVLGAESDLSQVALLNETNTDRQSEQRAPLTLNTQLEQAAQAKAADMVARDYWSHVTPTGEQPWSFVTATGYQYEAAGENLAYGFTNADAVSNAWMQSPSHRANLLNTNYSQVGFGVAQSQNFNGHGPETVVVAVYASPAGSPAILPATTVPDKTILITRMQAMAAPALSGLIVGAIGALAVVAVLLRHSFAWRKLLNKGELFVVQHPALDLSFVAIAVVAVLLNHTAGFIR